MFGLHASVENFGRAKEEHINDFSHVFECETCNRSFRTWYSRRQHMDAVDHWAPTFECQMCTSAFRTQHAANQHMNAKDHWLPTVPCDSCPKKFHTQQAVENHMRAKGHYKNYCRECQRLFMNEHSLRQHLNSGTHRGINFTCYYCMAGFVTASGEAHHIESGACPEAREVNRDSLLSDLQALDPMNILCKEEVAPMDYIIPKYVWNGSSWECRRCKKRFNKKISLEAHARSPVHREKAYHCPNWSCSSEFISLAAFYSHLESESCGFIPFERVDEIRDQVSSAIRGDRLITGF